MKTILLMRHSHAVSNNPAFSDHERPLTDNGRNLAAKTAELLAQTPVDRIICSSATRAVETASIVLNACQNSRPLDIRNDLYLAPSETYPRVAAELGTPAENAILFVGHNPGLALQIGKWAETSLAIPPACVAIFDTNIDDWNDLTKSTLYSVKLTALISDGLRRQ